jgi:hypothetical protein
MTPASSTQDRPGSHPAVSRCSHRSAGCRWRAMRAGCCREHGRFASASCARAAHGHKEANMARHWRCRVRVHRWSPTATLKAAGIASACCAASKANGGVPAGAPESSSSGQEFGRAAITQLAWQRISLERATLGSVSGAGVVLGHEDGWRISGHRGACHGFWPAGVGTAAGTAGTRLAETDGLRYLRIERLQPGDQLLDAPACCPSSAASAAASLDHRRPACRSRRKADSNLLAGLSMH